MLMEWRRLKRLIIPEPGQVIICLASSLVIIVLIFRDWLSGYLTRPANISSSQLANTYQQQLALLNQSPLVRNAAIVIFWAAVGLLAYLFYLILSNLLIDVRNEVVIETGYKNQGRLQQKLKMPLL